MQRQDFDGAVPMNGAGDNVPVESGGAGGLCGEAQAQFVFQLVEPGDVLALLQCGVQHDHHPRAFFCGLLWIASIVLLT